MNLEKLSIKYDRLYEKADRLFKKHNPCQFIDGLCIKNRKNGGVSNGCCHESCDHLGPRGCTIKSLGCKLFTCDYICENHEMLDKKICKLRRKAGMKSFSLVPCYLTKEDVFRQLAIIKRWTGGIE